MSKKNIESIKELKDICSKGIKEYWYMRLVMRRLSIYVTKLFLKMNISANQTTLFAMSFSIAGGIFLAIGEYWYAIIGALFFNLWLVFDCVDGQIARYHGSSSAIGQIFDSMDADICYAILFISAGIGVYNSTPFTAPFSFLSPIYTFLGSFDPVIFVILGAIASLLKILSRFFAIKLSKLPTAQISLNSKGLKNDVTKKSRLIKRLAIGLVSWIDFTFLNQAGLLHLLVLVAAILYLLPLWVIFNGVSLLVLFVLGTIIRIRSYL